MDGNKKARGIALHDRSTQGARDRRAFLRAMGGLAGSMATAQTLAATFAASPAVAAIVAPDDKRLRTSAIHWPATDGRTLHGYMAIPAKARGRQPAVMVVHDDRGLDDHIRDLTRRIALEGFVVCAPDFFWGAGETSADRAAARATIGRLDLARTVADAAATVHWLATNRYATGKVGAVGFGWGGALVDRTAIAAGSELVAAVAYYGPAPDPAEAARVKAAMLLHFGALDHRINQSGRPWAAALEAASVPTQAWFYEGADHAFDDDSSAGRYDPAAAALAWRRTVAFLKDQLEPPRRHAAAKNR